MMTIAAKIGRKLCQVLLVIWCFIMFALLFLLSVRRACLLHWLRSKGMEGSEILLLYPNTGKCYDLSVDFHAEPYEEIIAYQLPVQDDISGSQATICRLPAFHSSTTYLSAEPFAALQEEEIKKYFCDDCQAELAEVLAGREVGTAVLYDVETGALYPIDPERSITISKAEIRIRRDETEDSGPMYSIFIHYTVDSTV